MRKIKKLLEEQGDCIDKIEELIRGHNELVNVINKLKEKPKNELRTRKKAV